MATYAFSFLVNCVSWNTIIDNNCNFLAILVQIHKYRYRNWYRRYDTRSIGIVPSVYGIATSLFSSTHYLCMLYCNGRIFIPYLIGATYSNEYKFMIVLLISLRDVKIICKWSTVFIIVIYFNLFIIYCWLNVYLYWCVCNSVLGICVHIRMKNSLLLLHNTCGSHWKGLSWYMFELEKCIIYS